MRFLAVKGTEAVEGCGAAALVREEEAELFGGWRGEVAMLFVKRGGLGTLGGEAT